MINEAKKGGAKFQQNMDDRDSDSGSPVESSSSSARGQKQERERRKEEVLFDPMILKDRQKVERRRRSALFLLSDLVLVPFSLFLLHFLVLSSPLSSFESPIQRTRPSRATSRSSSQ
eukprot:614895-Hanusia_phi.AAC.2